MPNYIWIELGILLGIISLALFTAYAISILKTFFQIKERKHLKEAYRELKKKLGEIQEEASE